MYCKIKLISYDLKLEEGRNTKPKTPLELRTCRMCNFNQVECKKHFIVQFPTYQPFRIKLFSNILCIDVKILEGDPDHVF